MGQAQVAVVVGEALLHLAAEQAAPGGQIHLQQVVIELGLEATAMGRQEGGGRVSGPAQRRAVGGGDRQIPQGFACNPRLAQALLGEGGEIIPALNPVLQVEAAQPMANQQDPEGHRRT